MKILLRFLLSVVAIFSMFSCNVSKETTQEPLNIIEGIQQIDGDWGVIKLYDQPTTGEEKPTIFFYTEEGRVAGTTPCNLLLGTYVFKEENPGKISFPQIGTTMMACPYQNIETSYLNALEEATDLRIRTNSETTQLFLLNKSEEIIIVLEKILDLQPEQTTNTTNKK